MDKVIAQARSAIAGFFALEAAGGIVLMAATATALLVSNSPLVGVYRDLLGLPVAIQVGTFVLSKSLLLWVNDGLMAIFFLLVGLEIKREVLEGELSSPSQVLLPIGAALGGMLVPACIYMLFNHDDAFFMRGWAIPTATDIAFALGILALLGKRVPVSLKLFLTTIAVADDLGAIVIIAIFYSHDLSTNALLLACFAIAMLVLLNRLGVRSLAAYVIMGISLWIFVLESGVHATLSGVILGLAIPHKRARASRTPLLRRLSAMVAAAAGPHTGPAQDASLLQRLEHSLHPWVAFAVLPLFALFNAGVQLDGVTLPMLLESVPLGIALGLALGKVVGVYAVSMVLIKLGLAKMPTGAGHMALLGTAVLCGIGFTMSLFIGMLAFGGTGLENIRAVRLGVLAGSFVSAIAGYLLLRHASKTT